MIVYDAVHCPNWFTDVDGDVAEDPRRLVPAEAVVGVVEVKSTLDDRTLDAAVGKLAEFDHAFAQCDTQSTYRPFRYIFSYCLSEGADFGGWSAPHRALTRYAGAATQPDGLFVLDSQFAVLDAGEAIGRSLALLRGKSLDSLLSDSWEVQNEIVKRDIQVDPSYCNDYFCVSAQNGFLLLAFFTFVLERASGFIRTEESYADLFCRWGGPALSELFAEPIGR